MDQHKCSSAVDCFYRYVHTYWLHYELCSVFFIIISFSYKKNAINSGYAANELPKLNGSLSYMVNSLFIPVQPEKKRKNHSIICALWKRNGHGQFPCVIHVYASERARAHTYITGYFISETLILGMYK